MANIGYIQVVRHCNHYCGFCSNPISPYAHTLESMQALVDDLCDRGYYGVVLTGGEPTLHPELPSLIRYAKQRGLHTRMITNGSRLSEPAFAQEVADAGLDLVHVSVYSVRPEVEADLRGTPNTLTKAFGALHEATRHGITVNINCVINKHNADHLDENVRYFVRHHPDVRHFVWNNLDPSMGRAEVNQDRYLHRLEDFRESLFRALRVLHATGRTFRVERVPLCYMPEFAWASTETRKIVKGEERVVHFLDAKQTVHQTEWDHIYTDACGACTLRPVCGGLFDQGDAYDPNELRAVSMPLESVVEAVITDPSDPSYEFRDFAQWKSEFDARVADAAARPRARPRDLAELAAMRPDDALPVGQVTDASMATYRKSQETSKKRAHRLGLYPERWGSSGDERGRDE